MIIHKNTSYNTLQLLVETFGHSTKGTNQLKFNESPTNEKMWERLDIAILMN